MHTLIIFSYVMFGGTTIDISRVVLNGYKDADACMNAGNGLTITEPPNAKVRGGINDLRTGFICVKSGTEKAPQ